MPTASPTVAFENAKSIRIRGASPAVRKPGSTPATTSATPVTSARATLARSGESRPEEII
jgi:hypothetical protein